MIVLSVQGTVFAHPASIISDIAFPRVSVEMCGPKVKHCNCHAGFHNAAIETRAKIKKFVDDGLKKWPAYRLVFTGHSLGAAVSAIVATELRNSGYAVDMVS